MSSTIESLVNREYQYGFTTDFEAETLPPGLSEETVRFISGRGTIPTLSEAADPTAIRKMTWTAWDHK